MKTIPMLCLALLFAGCGNVTSKNNPTNVAPNNANNVSNVTNNDPNNQNNVACDDPPPGCGICSAPVCEDGAWVCMGTPCAQNSQNSMTTDCPAVDESSLSGVSIRFGAERCVWTLDEAAAGIDIPYTISVVEEQQIMPTSQQNGCDEPGPSGLRPQERLFGGDESYCVCDVGLCNGEPIVVDLVPGDYDFSMSWDGVNWIGPSDFGNPKGEPFPPGVYTAQVRAIGTFGDGEAYDVTATMQIELTE